MAKIILIVVYSCHCYERDQHLSSGQARQEVDEPSVVVVEPRRCD